MTRVTALIGLAVIALAIFVTVVASYVSAANLGNATEAGIKATYQNNENILAQYTNQIGEMAQVPEMQRDDLKEVYREAMGARYGEDGSKAVFQWLQEQNPQLNNAIYTNLQNAVVAGRGDFSVEQTKLIDQRRAYETALGTVWQGFWLNMAGYPKINLEKEYLPISNTYADEAFKTGKEDGVTFRKK